MKDLDIQTMEIRENSFRLRRQKSKNVVTSKAGRYWGWGRLFKRREHVEKTVRFSTREQVVSTVSRMDLTEYELRERWYSREELFCNKLDVKDVIQQLRTSGNRVDGLSEEREPSPAATSLFDQEYSITSDSRECTTVRGCERFYDAEMRKLIQHSTVDAVLEAQRDFSGDSEMIRRVSESLSQSSRDLARWHAKLNAFHCWGSAGFNNSLSCRSLREKVQSNRITY